MKNIFSSKSTRNTDNEVKDLQKKNIEQVSSSISSNPPLYYYQPSSTPSTTDSYSHMANSTAGYTQNNAYPSLARYNQEQTLPSRIESLPTYPPANTTIPTTNKINEVNQSRLNVQDLLQNGAVVQLVSKNSGHLLQVVMSSNGTLVFDGSGSANAFNTYFTVESIEKGRVRFHNNYNYLAFDGKQPCIMSFPPGPKNNPSIDFRIHDIHGTNEFVAFESCSCKNHFIAILADGHLKTTNIKDKTIDAQFSIVPMRMNQQPMFPYQPQPYQQFNMNPYGGPPASVQSQSVPLQQPLYHQQLTKAAPVSLPSAQNFNNQPPISSGLYPQFN